MAMIAFTPICFTLSRTTMEQAFSFYQTSLGFKTPLPGISPIAPPAMATNLFRGNPWRHDQPWSMFEKWLATQDAERVAKDIEACTKWMVEEFLAAGISSKLGIIGFCYGGRLVIDVLARDYGSCFGTGVSFYGTRMDNSVASDVKVPVLFITGDKDPLCPVDGLRELAQTVGDDSKVVVFNGRGHGFAHRPQSNEEDTDAEEAFLTMRHWLHDHLVQSVL